MRCKGIGGAPARRTRMILTSTGRELSYGTVIGKCSANMSAL